MQITVNQNPKLINPENYEVPAAKTVAPSFDECKIEEPSVFYDENGLFCVGNEMAYNFIRQKQQEAVVAPQEAAVAPSFSPVEICQ